MESRRVSHYRQAINSSLLLYWETEKAASLEEETQFSIKTSSAAALNPAQFTAWVESQAGIQHSRPSAGQDGRDLQDAAELAAQVEVVRAHYVKRIGKNDVIVIQLSTEANGRIVFHKSL